LGNLGETPKRVLAFHKRPYIGYLKLKIVKGLTKKDFGNIMALNTPKNNFYLLG